MIRPLAVVFALAISNLASAAESVDFNFDIKPILSDRCYVCHGPDQDNREADLRLDLKEGAYKESESGNVEKVVEPGDHKSSELWLRIVSDDPDVVMPPPDSNLALTKSEKATLRRWIDQGADWKAHWAFLPIPERVVPPEATSPESKRPTQIIDRFIEAKLSEASFGFSEQASKETLIRRVTFDITGVPPTLEQIDAFLQDESGDAFEKVVDRLLGSSRYGERMASIWLDAARYSDTYGYQVDRERFVWPYRDWVVRQFNANLPYDQFITQQLAGDLLPDAGNEELLATTFNRLHPQKVEGGSVPEEFRIEYVADRTQTFATSMLGLTFECARCHDHKYDPISQKEYYQLTAFFDNIDESGLYSYFTPSVPTPTLLLGDEGFESNLASARTKRQEAEVSLSTLRKTLEDKFDRDAISIESLKLPEPIEHLAFEEEKHGGQNESVEGPIGKAVKLSGDDVVKLKKGNFARYEPFSISLWLKVPKEFERSVVFHRSRAWTDAGSRGYECVIVDGHLTASLIHFWPGNAISVRVVDPMPVGEWHHITLTYDGSSRAAGLRLYLDGDLTETKIVWDNLYKEITGGGNDHVSIGERFRDIGFKQGLVDEFKLFDRELTAVEANADFENEISKELPDSEAFELSLVSNSEYLDKLEKVEAARKHECDLLKDVKEIMVMRESPKRRDTFVLNRGAYDARGEKVAPATLSVLPPMETGDKATRLGLAHWLTEPNHPLTSRVAVNRLWQTVFGTGLVRTPEDFGSQGQLPTHPKLLDYLARDFIEYGWDTKRLVKQLVMSQTYQQTSKTTGKLLEADPENKLYGRSPSYRLSAEMLRDQALSVSGLLVEKLGGTPVKPYDLKDSFKPMEPDKGEGLYRRSLYTYWKRTGPSPAMMALDASKRDVCRVQRGLTSSPLQTLVLMNGPQFVEASRAIAESLLVDFDKANDRLASLFRRLTSRNPTDDEMQVLAELYESQRKRFAEDANEAEAYLEVGFKKLADGLNKTELAALSSVANALFGLDEVMMKR